MRRLLSCLFPIAALAIAAPAWAASTTANFNIGVTQTQAIASLGLSNSSFTGGAASGTVVGAISVVMAPATPAFSGTLSLTGANASNFQIVGANLETNGVVPVGSYSITIVASQPGATGSPFAQAETITGTGAVATCPQGIGYADGCAGANINGSAKITNFFTTYTGTNYSAHRPPWNVAGVDYPVGYDKTVALRDPSVGANLPSCATYSNHVVTVNSAPCTLSGYDFSAQGCIGLRISNSISNGNNVTITNNKFGYGPSCAGFTSAWVSLGGSDPGGANIIISYNEFDDSYAASFEEIIGKAFVGNLTAQYNAFFNTDKDTWHAAASTGTVLLRYNYGEGFKNGSGAHCQFTYINDGGAAGHPNDAGNWRTEFNTGFLNSGSVCGTAVYSYATGGSGGMIIPTGTISNNTVATPYGGANRLLDIGYPTGSPNEIDNLTINNNYVAPGPAASGWLLVNGGTFVIGSSTCHGNVSMQTGATQAGTFGSGSHQINCN